MTIPRMAYLTRVIRHGRIRSDESYRTGGRRKPGPIVHGTPWGYVGRGCRCEACTEAKRAAEREYAHRPKTWPTWAHGRLTTYKQGCRCEVCRGANTRAHADWKARCRPKPQESPLDRRRTARKEYENGRNQQIKAGTWEVKRG